MRKTCVAFIAFFACFAFPLWALGLSALGEVTFDNVAIGKSYSLSELKKRLFWVKNNSQEPLEIMLDIAKPAKNEKLTPGYKPIPDTKWIKLPETKLLLKAQEEKSLDIKIAIPADKKLRGKKFQAFIVVQSLSKAKSVSLTAAIKSKLYINITP